VLVVVSVYFSSKEMYGTVLCEREDGDVREGCHSWIHVGILVRPPMTSERPSGLDSRLAIGQGCVEG
jgi:hypothetical protein